jgi:hypothetical protein
MEPPIGQLTDRAVIVDITSGLPCEVTTDEEHSFPNKSFVRITELDGAKIVPPAQPHGMDQLNNNKYRIIVTDVDKFTLQDPITYRPIDSSTFPPYIQGGSCNLVQPTFIFYPSPDQEFPN